MTSPSSPHVPTHVPQPRHRQGRGAHRRGPRRQRGWALAAACALLVGAATAATLSVNAYDSHAGSSRAGDASHAASGAGTADARATAPSPTPSPTPSAPEDIHLTIGYAGDVLTHMPVMRDTAGGQGDLAPLVAAATPWTSGVDLALCGMEVPVSPRGVASGYPTFGSLPGVVSSLAATGWDGCATASNHSWDQGWGGVLATADAMEANHLGYAGTNRTEAEAARPYQLYTLEREGRTVTVAQLSTTYSLNGFTADPAWAVQLNDVQWVAQQARAARSEGADVVVLHSQLGAEYSRDPVEEQVAYAQAIAATGEVDVLFSAHPHVPQTNELLAGGPGGRGMWVSYSAGNFISNQSEEGQGTIMATIGLFVWVDVTVSDDAEGARSVSVDGLHWHPFTVDRLGGHRLIDLAGAHSGSASTGTLSAAEIERRWAAVTSIVNTQTYSEAVPTPSGEAPTALPRAAQ